MRLGIIILLACVLFSCNEEPEPWKPDFQTKEEVKEFFLGKWRNGRITITTAEFLEIEFFKNEELSYSVEINGTYDTYLNWAKYEVISLDELKITRDFGWMNEETYTGEVIESWSPWYEGFKEPTLNKITFFTQDSILIENFDPDKQQSSPDNLIFHDMYFIRLKE